MLNVNHVKWRKFSRRERTSSNTSTCTKKVQQRSKDLAAGLGTGISTPEQFSAEMGKLQEAIDQQKRGATGQQNSPQTGESGEKKTG